MSIAQDGVQGFSSLKLPFTGPGPELATPRIGVRVDNCDGDVSDIAERHCGEHEPFFQRGLSDKGSPLSQLKKALSMLFSPPMTEQNAASVMKQFMNANSGGGLTRSQMQSIADTGEFNGQPVSGSVLKAAQKMMANGGALFDKLDNANKPWEKDGFVANSDIDVAQQTGMLKGSPIQQLADALKQLLKPPMTEQNAADVIKQFMQQTGDGLTKDQMQQMANDGYVVKNGEPMRISPEVQQAAQKMMANGGALFNKLDSANKPWEKDGFVAIVDVNVATQNNELSKGGLQDLLSKLFSQPMSNRKAGNIIGQFAQANGGLNETQLKQLATGYFVKNGDPMRVSPDIKEAAQKLLSNGESQPWERYKPTININIKVTPDELKAALAPTGDVSKQEILSKLTANHYSQSSLSSQGCEMV